MQTKKLYAALLAACLLLSTASGALAAHHYGTGASPELIADAHGQGAAGTGHQKLSNAGEYSMEQKETANVAVKVTAKAVDPLTAEEKLFAEYVQLVKECLGLPEIKAYGYWDANGDQIWLGSNLDGFDDFEANGLQYMNMWLERYGYDDVETLIQDDIDICKGMLGR